LPSMQSAFAAHVPTAMQVNAVLQNSPAMHGIGHELIVPPPVPEPPPVPLPPEPPLPPPEPPPGGEPQSQDATKPAKMRERTRRIPDPYHSQLRTW
jgi:hypothetical protein